MRSQAGSSTGDPGRHERHTESGQVEGDVIYQAEGLLASREYLLNKNMKCHPSSSVRRPPGVCGPRKAHFIAKKKR